MHVPRSAANHWLPGRAVSLTMYAFDPPQTANAGIERVEARKTYERSMCPHEHAVNDWRLHPLTPNVELTGRRPARRTCPVERRVRNHDSNRHCTSKGRQRASPERTRRLLWRANTNGWPWRLSGRFGWSAQRARWSAVGTKAPLGSVACMALPVRQRPVSSDARRDVLPELRRVAAWFLTLA